MGVLWVVALLAFDPGATQRALANEQGREAALRQVLTLGPGDRARARRAGIAARIAGLAADSAAALPHRILAVRATARLGSAHAAPLAPLVRDTSTPEATALAREAARALRQLGQVGALAGAEVSPDPEIRAAAAAAGAGSPQALCMLLDADPWPRVRLAAAQGLAQHPDSADCLRAAFAQPGRVGVAAVETAALLDDPGFRADFRKIAGNPRHETAARAEAVVALARLGDRAPADAILETHLSSGGIEPLAMAALRALVVVDDRAALRRALESKSGRVKVAAAQALLRLGDAASLPSIRALLTTLPRRGALQLREAMGRHGVPVTAPVDPADIDPE